MRHFIYVHFEYLEQNINETSQDESPKERVAFERVFDVFPTSLLFQTKLFVWLKDVFKLQLYMFFLVIC